VLSSLKWFRSAIPVPNANPIPKFWLWRAIPFYSTGYLEIRTIIFDRNQAFGD